MKKISIIIAGRHATSITLEEEFYIELQEIARQQQKSINALVTEIDSSRQDNNLCSAIRLYILDYFKQKINSSKTHA